MTKWVSFDEHPPLSSDIVEIRDNGNGQSFAMRIPCRRYYEMIDEYPDLKIEYRKRNTPEVGDEVCLLSGWFNILPAGRPRPPQPVRGVVSAKNGADFMIDTIVMKGVSARYITVHCYESEMVLLSDKIFNETYGV